jgi:hypothetical protein
LGGSATFRDDNVYRQMDQLGSEIGKPRDNSFRISPLDGDASTLDIVKTAQRLLERFPLGPRSVALERQFAKSSLPDFERPMQTAPQTALHTTKRLVCVE